MSTPPNSLVVAIDKIPAGGLALEGEIHRDIFGIEGEGARPRPPVRFTLRARLDGDLLVVEGHLSADFDLECVRCLERFPFRVEIDPWIAEFPVKNAARIDLTDRIREDILLDLPGYPKCESSNLEERTCPSSGRFEGGSGSGNLRERVSGEESSAGSDVWKTLDQLRPDDPPKD